MLARTFLKDLEGAVFSWLPDPVKQFDISHPAQLDGWQDSLGRKCHDAEQLQFLVKRNVNQTCRSMSSRAKTKWVHPAASP